MRTFDGTLPYFSPLSALTPAQRHLSVWPLLVRAPLGTLLL
jgi:hypothetical protein